MQFPDMEVKIAVDALENSKFSYFLMAHDPSSPSSPPLYTSPDLHTLHLLDEFLKGTSGWTRLGTSKEQLRENRSGLVAFFYVAPYYPCQVL